MESDAYTTVIGAHAGEAGVVVALGTGLLAGCTTLRATPPVTPTEADAAWSWEDVLRTRVDERGRVDFRRLAAARGPLDIVVADIARREGLYGDEEQLTRNDRPASYHPRRMNP